MSQIVLKYPSHVRLELTQGCNRSCHSCPVISNRSKHKFMDEVVFSKVCSHLDSRVNRLELSMHGEPLLNPSLLDYIRNIRTQLPDTQISIITNTEVFTTKPELLLDVFSAGLNFIHADTYTEKSKTAFIKVVHDLKPFLKEQGIIAQYFVKGGINIWKQHNSKLKYILLSDESKGINIIEKHAMRKVHTWAGNLPLERWGRYDITLNQFPMMKKCTEPMKCAPIDIYGNVSLCCADYAKSYVYGSLKEKSLEDIWNGERIQKVRFTLSQGWRHIIPACFFCAKPSFRIGLWPYRGREWTEKYMKSFFKKNSFVSDNLKKLFIEHDKTHTHKGV